MPSKASLSVIDHRRQQVAKANVRHRVVVGGQWLDTLEEAGYVGPGGRGNRADECEAIETFLADSLARPDGSERPHLRPAPTKVLLVRSD
jgi:hypothetical protein